jgi:hypothetical protein
VSEGSDEGVDSFNAAGAEEEFVRGEGLLGVGVGVAEGAEAMLEVGLETVRVAV